jgi:hypothetical protein
MNDDSATGTVRESLTAARDSLTEVHMSTPLDAIVRHGRVTRRRHRLIGLAGTGAVAAAAALVVGLTGVTGTAPAHHPAVIRTAAFTITRNANGTATLTINPQVLFDPSTLQSDLAQYGIPAKVTTGSFCSSDPAPSGFSQVVTFSPALQGDSGQQQIDNPTITINPATMPAGTELSVGAFQVSNGDDTALALINTNSYTCTSTAPTTPPSSGGLLHWNGSAGS